MKNVVRYCWILPDFSFSGSWSEIVHNRIMDEYTINSAKKKGYRIMKYMIVEGEDFELPTQSHLALTKKGNIKKKGWV